MTLDAWDLLKAVFTALFGLVLWAWRREIKAREDMKDSIAENHEELTARIRVLEDRETARQARRDLWHELGKPERRDE